MRLQAESMPPTTTAPRRSAWVEFAGIMTILTGGLNALDGFIGYYRATYFRDVFIFGNLRTWSIVLLVFGFVQILAGLAIFRGQGWGRWFAIVTVTINAILQLSIIGAYPFSAVTIILYDVAILYALAARWHPRPSIAVGS